ncbi:RNA-binding domain-containing protein [Xylaria bambusicola]|uniref:RNA-binding domain-containing protein n=1 Tax=Xylaria bambusicola TaxID=326684 RepID=UPI0020072AB3|nr:RNA-binding domain-containing protein [Xylaria bambusicola]KAI0513218.1 RNA-binding domain-containing protein [Xylaria bambusicola]
MPELRPRKAAPAKSAPKEKTPSKRKAAANDDSSPIATKKVKGDVKPKKAKRSSSLKEPEEEPAIDDDEDQVSGDDEALALAKIVDSDAEADDGDDATPDEEIKGLELPKVSKQVTKSSETDNSEPGVVYVGRIPRGFYEHQMREYFSQFGDVSRIRMSRNKLTGQSKHFAFIEFAEHGVAEIVAKTMDNYLLAGHILKVKMVPKSQIHEKLWVGANKRFKKIPWNKMAGNKLKKPLSESAWTEKISKEETKRNERAKKLLELGYEFEAPKLKSVHDTDGSTAALEAAEEVAPKAIEAGPEATPKSDEAESEPAPVTKKAPKGDKKPAAKAGKKAKKGKKAAS